MSDAAEASVIPAAAGNGVNLDPNHPYFLHSSDAPRMSLVIAVFDGIGFQGWRRSVLITLSTKNKLGFINGSCPTPTATSKDHQPWSRCNDMVTSSLLNSLSKDIGDNRYGNQSPKLPTAKAKKSKFNPNVSCTYCKKIGHSVSHCYRIIGFPESFEFTNGKTGQGSIRSNRAFSEDQGGDANNNYNDALEQHLSKDQFSQLIELIKQVKVSDSGISNSEVNANAVAGTIVKYYVSCFSVFNSRTWIIDSGASEHMCFDSNAFISLTPLFVSLHINLLDSSRITITHIGKIFILPNYVLERVLYVPTFRYNLLSVNRFCSQFLCINSFSSNQCLLKASLIKSAQVFGKAREGLYLLKPTAINSRNSNRENVALFLKHSDSVKYSVPFHFSANAISHVLTYNGYKYFLTIVDDYSRVTWTFLLSTKSNAFGVLKNFLVMIERQFGVKGKKGYKLLELDTKKIIMSRDVHFFEDMYPFVSNPTSSSPDPIFPISSPTDTTYPISPAISPSLNAD
ncbi:uncharacterized protein [Nicotiana tomentosiformis]|uniref:uncharacterized protein n=1 Tax=Nicotiana tomentosiformis TaxID=4098 RepID=UPI00388CAE19